MSNFTEERIKLMDNVYNHLIDYFIKQSDRANPSADLYAKRLNIGRDMSQWLIDEVAKLGHELNLLFAQRHGSGTYSIVRMITINATDFQNDGGFTTYFNELHPTSSLKLSHVTVINNGNSNTITIGDENKLNANGKGNI